MTQGTATPPSQREDRIIIVFVRQEEYDAIIGQPQKFRALLDRDYRLNPENYPETFEQGYKLHDKAVSVGSIPGKHPCFFYAAKSPRRSKVSRGSHDPARFFRKQSPCHL